jgi:Acyl-CoA dehydrogenase, C-terminal domain
VTIKETGDVLGIAGNAERRHAGRRRIVDRALDLSGGFGMFKKSEIDRLFRDARPHPLLTSPRPW